MMYLTWGNDSSKNVMLVFIFKECKYSNNEYSVIQKFKFTSLETIVISSKYITKILITENQQSILNIPHIISCLLSRKSRQLI